MIRYRGDWTKLRRVPGLREIDFHRGRRDRTKSYMDCMAEVYQEAFDAIRQAHRDGYRYLLIGHGYSTSGPFRRTARSQIRRLLRSPEVTPFVNRSETVQHEACVRVALKPRVRALKLSSVLSPRR